MEHYRLEVNGTIRDVTSEQLRVLVKRRFVKMDDRIWVGARECLVGDVWKSLEASSPSSPPPPPPSPFASAFNSGELFDRPGFSDVAFETPDSETASLEERERDASFQTASVSGDVSNTVFERQAANEVVEFLGAGEIRRSAMGTILPILLSVGGAAVFFIVFLLIQARGNNAVAPNAVPDQANVERSSSEENASSSAEGERSEAAGGAEEPRDAGKTAAPTFEEQLAQIMRAFNQNDTDATREIEQFGTLLKDREISQDSYDAAKVLAAEYVVGLKMYNRVKMRRAPAKAAEVEEEIRASERRYGVAIKRTGREGLVLGRGRVFCHDGRQYALDVKGFEKAFREETFAEDPQNVRRKSEPVAQQEPSVDVGALAADVTARLDQFAESGDVAAFMEAAALADANRAAFETRAELSDVQKRLVNYQTALDRIGGYVYAEKTLKSRYPTLGYTYELETLFKAVEKFLTTFEEGAVVVTLTLDDASGARHRDELKITATEFKRAAHGEIVKTFGTTALAKVPGAKCELVVNEVERFAALRFDSAVSAKRYLSGGVIGVAARTSDESRDVARGMKEKELKLVENVSAFKELKPDWSDFLPDAVEPADAWASKKPSLVVPDDASSLRQALEKTADGDVIMIRAGTVAPLVGQKIAYGESAKVIVDHSVQIVGETGDAKDATIEIGDMESLTVDTSAPVAFKGVTISTVPASWGREILPSIAVVNGSDVAFHSCAFKGNGVEETTGVLISGRYAKAKFWKCSFEQYGQHALRIVESPEVEIELSVFKNGNHCAIYALDKGRARIDKCLFEKNRAAIQASGGGGFTATNSYFIGNRYEQLVSAGSDKAYELGEGNVIEK